MHALKPHFPIHKCFLTFAMQESISLIKFKQNVKDNAFTIQ